MTRLLQGDVGSGKTLVALIAMLQAVEAGCQAALMAPTEVLARQHAATLAKLLLPLGLDVELLTGSEPAARRRRALERIAGGQARIVVGTHALFQPSVTFRALGLAVVDEQHRFGVAQRLALLEKGEATDLLLMSATPIPRTLLLAAYGDVAVSSLRTKPPGREPVETRLVSDQRLDELMEATERALAGGERIYWVCPLIEESETADQAAALERYAALKERFGDVVGLVHGRLAGPEKAAAVDAFARGDTRLLVATTVIEVGVDVPEAGVIVIEQAERFGLAQLHQLRGRVGRGERPSTCVLLYRAPLGPVARERLKVLRETTDGFIIAEADLRLRGPGEALEHAPERPAADALRRPRRARRAARGRGGRRRRRAGRRPVAHEPARPGAAPPAAPVRAAGGAAAAGGGLADRGEQPALQHARRRAGVLDREVAVGVAVGGRELRADAHPRALPLGRQRHRDPRLPGLGRLPGAARRPVVLVPGDQDPLAVGPVLRGRAARGGQDPGRGRLGREAQVADGGHDALANLVDGCGHGLRGRDGRGRRRGGAGGEKQKGGGRVAASHGDAPEGKFVGPKVGTRTFRRRTEWLPFTLRMGRQSPAPAEIAAFRLR